MEGTEKKKILRVLCDLCGFIISGRSREGERRLLRMSPNQTAPQVLIADDQPAVLDALRLLLKEEGWRGSG